MYYYLFEFLWQCSKLKALLSCPDLHLMQDECTEMIGCLSLYDKKLKFTNMCYGRTDFSASQLVNIDLGGKKRFLFIRTHLPPGVHRHDDTCKWQHNEFCTNY